MKQFIFQATPLFIVKCGNCTIPLVDFQLSYGSLFFMRYIGIDYGTKRIGLALSDDSGVFAFPHAIIPTHKAVDEIILLIQNEHIGAVVIGHSIATNSAENEIGKEVASFIKKLSVYLPIPIYSEREDFSSFEAHRYQTSAGNRDDSAAAIILQRFLDKQPKK